MMRMSGLEFIPLGKMQLLEREKARDLETFGERAMQLAMREEIQIHSFEETTGRWRYHLQPKENLQK